ncbi:MAG: hypothetical protein Q9191_008262, partial [Dirinaria sp. TL-2023a]
FEVEIIDIAPQHLRPPTPFAALDSLAFYIAARQRIHTDRIAHTRKLRAEGWVGFDGVGMLKGEVVQQGLEDGELGFQRIDVLVADGGAVRGILGRERRTVLEGGETDSAARRHVVLS